ncbi:MAG TPA: SRPBCC family protein [Nocardioidaceae bacterium]|nr:SRPBCC family protein [Nocardioidaceae bacterium]
MIVNVEVEVARPREQVFDLMADARNETEWNSQVTRSDLITGEPVEDGSEFATTNRGNEYIGVIRTYDRPNRLDFEVVGKPLEISATFRFVDSEAGTRMSATFDLKPQSYMKVLLPLISGAVKKDFPKQLGHFKEFCESQAGV